VQVVMQSLDFSPTGIAAKVGQEVVWTNNDAAPHNVTYVSGPRFGSSRTLGRGKQFSIRLTEPGTIRYVCTLHPWMKATIVVAP
jgi:plastocyanin